MSRLLLSADPSEPQHRRTLEDLLGREDADVIVRWLWENHRNRKEPTFGKVLEAIVQQTMVKGPAFARNLLDFAKKPKHVREAELEMMQWITPRINAAALKVHGHRGNQDVARSEFDLLCYQLEEKLCEMWPGKHRATMKGAIICAFEHRQGEFSLNVAKLVEALNMHDPLEATAAASRG